MRKCVMHDGGRRAWSRTFDSVRKIAATNDRRLRAAISLARLPTFVSFACKRLVVC